MDYIKVKDKDNLLRDAYSQGIVNCDVESYNAYIENYKKRYNDSKKIVDIESDIDSLKSDILEIKTLLRSLVDGSR